MELLKLEKISLAFQGNKVLKNISFSVHKKEVICVIGESGCGKTTLLKAIQGLLDLDKGKIVYQNKIIEGPSMQLVPGTKGIAMVYQDYNLEEHLSVYYNVKRELNHLAVKDQEKITKKVLKICQIDKIHDRFPRQISGGQRQKVALAKALIGQPKLILLDEPFSNLDAISKQNFKAIINELKTEQELSFLYVTHDINDALTFADKIIILDNGKIAVNCKTEELYHQINSLYVAKILGLKNIVKGELLNLEFNLMCLPNSYYWIPFSAINYQESENKTGISLKTCFLGDETSICFKFRNGFELYSSSLKDLQSKEYQVFIDDNLLIQLD